ncbi:MAG: hypothetical protein IJ848_03980 [Alphaproteobacteria bacterium]|nr:hypothetical protein [Alphaproteobacteria bacterium]
MDFKVAKNISRLAAIQLMYEKDILNINTDSALLSFKDYMDNDKSRRSDESIYNNMHSRFFKKLTSHFHKEIDFNSIYNECISNSKMIINSEMLNSIIKVAILEMMYEKTDLPIVINEYVEISKDFTSDREVKLINAILDKISKHITRQCTRAVATK